MYTHGPMTTKPAARRSQGLGSDLYDEAYYHHSLPGTEQLGNAELVDAAAPDTIRFGNVVAGQRVLDFGCGRGACAVEIARAGCTVVGVDYSPHAIRFAQEFVRRFSDEIQQHIEFRQMTMDTLNFENEFDTIVFNQVYEHLYDWQLEALITKFKRALKPSGVLAISTPNRDYIRYLFPVKRMVDLPFKIIKEFGRLLRGKSRHASSVRTFLKEIFKIRYPESEHTQLHINLQTPRSIKKFLESCGLRVQVTCVDRHTNLLGLITRPWWGETIWVTCTL